MKFEFFVVVGVKFEKYAGRFVDVDACAVYAYFLGQHICPSGLAVERDVDRYAAVCKGHAE